MSANKPFFDKFGHNGAQAFIAFYGDRPVSRGGVANLYPYSIRAVKVSNTSTLGEGMLEAWEQNPAKGPYFVPVQFAHLTEADAQEEINDQIDSEIERLHQQTRDIDYRIDHFTKYRKESK